MQSYSILESYSIFLFVDVLFETAWYVSKSVLTRFVQTLESVGFYCSEFQAQDSPEKGIGPGKSWKVLEL